MRKKGNEIALREAAKSAGLVARQFARVEQVAAAALEGMKAAGPSLRIVAAAGNVSGIDAPGLHIAIENGAFAVSIKGERGQD